MSGNSIEGKCVVVTGGAQGLGRATALALAKRGAHVALFDLNEEKLRESARACEQAGGTASWHLANVADEASVREAFAALESPPFGLVNNAGITRDALMVKKSDDGLKLMSLAEWQAVIDVNLTGVFLCGREAAARMVEAGAGGVIVNISSISRAGNFGQTNYAAAKAGVAAMAVVWAKELARHGIRCAAVAPGVMNTDMVASMKPEAREALSAGIPLRRLGEPEHIAEAVAFVFENEYFSGRVIEVDGGLRL